jgi:hypothetical protein
VCSGSRIVCLDFEVDTREHDSYDGTNLNTWLNSDITQPIPVSERWD